MESNGHVPGALAIGVAFPGDSLDPGTWSGTPSGIAGGLRALEIPAVPVRAQLPGRLDPAVRALSSLARIRLAPGTAPRAAARRAHQAALVSPELALANSVGGRLSLRRSCPLAGVVQIGTGYTLAGARTVTFEDITIVQARRYPYPGWGSLSERAVARRIERQRRAYQAAVACCVTTTWVADSIVNDYGIPRQKVHVVGVGRNHSVEPASRDWSTPRFLFVGKDWVGKNGDGLLRAFALLRRAVPEARLDVVGRHPPIDQEGVTGHGFLSLGVPAERQRVDELFRRATCFVLPSHFEASAIVHAEAGAAGLPSIGSAVGGSGEIIGEGGMTVDPDDQAGLVEAMLALCDPRTAERLGALARRRAELYTWTAVAERLVRALALPGVDPSGLAPFIEGS